MGTKKFPIENEYGQYLSANSGSSNAYTAATDTNYFFDVAAKPANDEDPSDTNPSPLREALDRFAQFFIEPLFLSSTLDRELKAVDSENKKNLQDDVWRLNQLEKSLSNPKHPYCHFSTGNLEVLKELPEANGINVRDKFMEFHAKHYSANRMKLVVLGREPLDVLQNWVVELFSDVVNKNLPPNRWTEELPLRDIDLGTQCFAKPVMDSRELNLIFPFIDEEFLFESQPSRYISHLIGHEGPGSIMSLIKAKGWANSLSAGSYPVCPGTPGMFDVQIRLTAEVCFTSALLMRRTNNLISGPQTLSRDCQNLLSVRGSVTRDASARVDFRRTKGHGGSGFQVQAKDTSEQIHEQNLFSNADAHASRVAVEWQQPSAQLRFETHPESA